MDVDEALWSVEHLGPDLLPDAASVLAAEVRRLRVVEERVERLLAECDRNEAHIRAHVPHLPPDGGSFSVHVIRRFLRDAPPRTTEGEP